MGWAAVPAQPGSAGGQESHLAVGSIGMHTQIKSQCAGDLEAGGQFPMEEKSGKEEGAPRKTIKMGKRWLIWPWQRGGKRRQPRDEGAAWGAACLGSGYAGERGEAFHPSSCSL